MIIESEGLLAWKSINPKYLCADKIAVLNDYFKKKGIVKLPDFLNEHTFDQLKSEALELSANGVRKNLIMPGYETPRRLSVVSGKSITRNSKTFPELYFGSELKAYLSKIVGNRLYNVDHPDEMIVINCIEEEAGTHGWHVDDPRFALVIIMEAPGIEHGGYLEYIPEWKQFCLENKLHPVNETNTGVKLARELGMVQKVHHEAGSCYLIDAANSLHRVAPIVTSEKRRLIANLAFHDEEGLSYGETANILYKDS